MSKRVGRLTIAVALAVACVWGRPAMAVRGGATPRAADALARATVAVSTLERRVGSLGLSYCSGVLVSSDEVLTAGHCVSGASIGVVVFASSGRSGKLSRYFVSKVTRYDFPGGRVAGPYATSLTQLTFDTALLHLSMRVPGTRPVALASNGAGVSGNLRLDGRGLSGRTVGVLRTATLIPLARTSTGLIVARSIGAQICRGDSGSPVVAGSFASPVLVGVASAVLTSNGTCGAIVVVAPVQPL
jgi:hypothetical protein